MEDFRPPKIPFYIRIILWFIPSSLILGSGGYRTKYKTFRGKTYTLRGE